MPSGRPVLSPLAGSSRSPGAVAAVGWGLVASVLLAAWWLRGALPPYDDAFFFVRLARHTVTAGVPAWNLADGPVHGNTSQLQQLWATLVWAVHPTHVVAWSRGLAVLALGAACGLLRGREGALLAVLGPVGLATLTTGMETALVIGLGAAFLFELRHRGRAGWLVAWAVLLYLGRPDTGLLTVGSLVVARRPRVVGAVLVAVGGALVALWAVYGSPLPTAFLTKLVVGTDAYGPAFLQQSAEAKLRHGLFFGWCVVPLVASLSGRAAWLQAAPGVAFVGYHLALTVDVMGMHGRFFAPALPWLVPAVYRALPWRLWAAWAAAGAMLWAAGMLPGAEGGPISQVQPVTYLAFAVAVAVAGRWLWPAVPAVLLLGVLAWPAHRGVPTRSDAVHVATYTAQVKSFHGLDDVAACLPAEVHVLHSEIGVPGMVLPQGRVTDLGGLMSPGWTHRTVDARCAEARPDEVFLPHEHYRRLRRALVEGQCLQGYRQAVVGGSSPMWLRRDHLPTMRACTARQGR